MRFNQSQYSIFKSIIKIYLVFVVLIISACASLISEKTENLACKNLSKVTDIDSLLFQMYSNIDSNCLFEMPAENLEKVWGIKVFDVIKNGITDDYKEYVVGTKTGLFVSKDYVNGGVSLSILRTLSYTGENEGDWGEYR